MNSIKRSSSFTQFSKKLRNESNRPIISIENLSDEIFYEIFDYIDAGPIYQIFFNLNYRFQQLLRSSSFLMKIKCQNIRQKRSHDGVVWDLDSALRKKTSGEEFMLKMFYGMMGISTDARPSEKISDYATDIPLRKVHMRHSQVLSIYSWRPLKHDIFFLQFMSDWPFSRLESLNFTTGDSHIFLSILSKIKSLPRLFSLTITHRHDYTDLTDIYRTILSLSVLKYYKFTTNKPYLSVLLPSASNERMNNIEHLVMNHHCTFEDLSMITSYTPKLRHLYFINEKESNNSIPENIYPIPLYNLTHLTIGDYYKNFNEFEIFISQLNLNLKFLSIAVKSEDITYLNASRWEVIILKYLPYLEKFYLNYSQKIHNEYQYPISSRQLNQFSSSFWIKRQWIMEIQFVDGYIIYLIRPYRKTWFLDCSFTQLALLYYPNEFGGTINADCRRILNAVQIYHLKIPDEKIFGGPLIELINFLPKLDSLKIHSLSFDPSGSLSIKELNTLCSIGNTCQITKVYLEKMTEIDEVYLLMKLCPCMTYLKVGYINTNKIKSILRNISKKINHKCISQLRSLCFHVLAIDDNIVKQLEEMINNENLLFNFTIKRVFDNIHLKWI